MRSKRSSSPEGIEGRQPRRHSGNTKKRLTLAASIAAGIVPVSAGDALAQDTSPLFNKIHEAQMAIYTATGGNKAYSYDPPSAIARGLGEMCTRRGYTDYMGSLTATKTSSNTIDFRVSERDAIAPATLARKNVASTELHPIPTTIGFNCNYSNEDTVMVRIMKRALKKGKKGKNGKRGKPRFGPWRKNGAPVQLTTNTRNLGTQPQENEIGPATIFRGEATAKGKLSLRMLRKKQYGIELTTSTWSELAPGTPHTKRRVMALKKSKQTVKIP